MKRSEQPAARQRGMRAWLGALLLAVLVALANYLGWALLHRPQPLPDWPQRVGGMAYSAFQRDQSPLAARFPDTAQLDADLELLARHTRSIRTYAVQENPQIAELARRHGLRLTAGAWLDRRAEHNQAEIEALLRQARAHPNIERALVGNEVLHRNDLPLAELLRHLDHARARLDIPVSTAEPWHQWLKYPELAAHVDYITVHLLPYWEGIPADQALAYAMRRYDEVQAAFPGKPILIGEIGWPSQGDRQRAARPSPAAQARFVREFLPLAQARQLDYFLMEAFDQPWKEALEGRVGAYWGVFDAWRQPKFERSGPYLADPTWWHKALAASLLALLPMVWFARRFQRFALAGRISYLALLQGATALAIWLVDVPFEYYLEPLDWAMQALLLPALLALLAVVLIAAFEVVEALAQRRWRRRFDLLQPVPGAVLPKVSIHLACHNEPPEMVMLTLDSLARLDYPDFEVLVVDNNTADAAVWQPVAEHCARLGPRFRFFHLRPWPGFKAGALNFALQQTAADAVLVAVVDSDYVVEPGWLRGLADHFEQPRVAVVQCPQAHRDFAGNGFRRLCNYEYDGFFRIGMHHRNERDAIIQHGTMTLIRAQALREVGGWAEWCICEDAELGLKLMEAGWQTRYVDRIMGRGLTPADFAAYKTQRFRWAFGAMQILRGHWNRLTGRSALTRGQRFHFLTGWFGWFADALHLLFTLLALAWTIGMLADRELFALPLQQFLLPVLGFTVLKAGFGILLYRTRVGCSWRDTLGAALASMALSHTIARGVLKGLVSRSHPFERTAKRRRLRRQPSPFAAVREELFLLAGLAVAALGVALLLGLQQAETRLWCAILAAQALPYLSAGLVAWIAARSAQPLPQASAVPAQVAALQVPVAGGQEDGAEAADEGLTA